MLRGVLAYLIAVLTFGTFMGWSNSLNPGSPLHNPFVAGYVFHALLWGGVFFTGFIRLLKITLVSRFILMVTVALTAGAIAYFYYSSFAGGEVTQNVLLGSGDDISTYKEYPIKGYELMGLLFFVIYIVMGFGQWVLSLHPKLKRPESKKQTTSQKGKA